MSKIEGGAFNVTTSLKNINISEKNENYKFENSMLLSKKGDTIYYVLSNSTYLEIPTTVTTIASIAFSGSNIERIKLPNSITNLTGNAFYGTSQLKEIMVEGDNPNYMVEGKGLYSKDKTTLIRYFGQDIIITLPEGLKKIGNYAIQNNITTQINLPTTLEVLNNSALGDANKVTQIEIPEKVKEIGNSSLPKNATVTVKENNPYFKSIDNMVLSKDGKILYVASRVIKEFNIPDTVETISAAAFMNNQQIEEIVLPISIKSIGREAFRASKLKKITIPNTIETIESNAFENCNNLTEIIITNIDPNKKEGSIEGSPWGCPYGARAVKWEK